MGGLDPFHSTLEIDVHFKHQVHTWSKIVFLLMIPKLGMFFFCCYLREISLIRITKEVLTLLKSVASLFVYPGLLLNNINYIPSPCVYVMLTVRSSCDRSSCRRFAMLSAVPALELVQLNDVALPFGHTAL